MNVRVGGYEAKEQLFQERMNRGLCEDVKQNRTGEVERATINLSEVIDRYENVAVRLNTRLSCVTSCAPPVASGQSNPSSGYQTALACHLDGLRSRLKDITDNLESMLERIEL